MKQIKKIAKFTTVGLFAIFVITAIICLIVSPDIYKADAEIPVYTTAESVPLVTVEASDEDETDVMAPDFYRYTNLLAVTETENTVSGTFSVAGPVMMKIAIYSDGISKDNRYLGNIDQIRIKKKDSGEEMFKIEPYLADQTNDSIFVSLPAGEYELLLCRDAYTAHYKAGNIKVGLDYYYTGPVQTGSEDPTKPVTAPETLPSADPDIEPGTEPTTESQAETEPETDETKESEASPTADIAMGDVTISMKDSYSYADVKKGISITALYIAKPLRDGIDYEIIVPDDLLPGGKNTLTIRGKGDYSGSVTRTISVGKGSISSDCSISVSNMTYTGQSLTPAVTVKDGSRTLKNGTDYSFTVSDNINAGTGTVTVTGKGVYTGSVKKTFSINRAGISQASVTASNVVYTGKELAPAPKVVLNKRTLVKDRDYTVSYSGNINAGTAVVTVSGKGNYTGTASGSFKVLRAALSRFTVSLDETSYEYSGRWCRPAVTVKSGSTVLTNGTDFSVSYQNNRDPGTATVIVTGRGNYTGTVTRQFTIAGV